MKFLITSALVGRGKRVCKRDSIFSEIKSQPSLNQIRWSDEYKKENTWKRAISFLMNHLIRLASVKGCRKIISMNDPSFQILL